MKRSGISRCEFCSRQNRLSRLSAYTGISSGRFNQNALSPRGLRFRAATAANGAASGTTPGLFTRPVAHLVRRRLH